MPPLVWHAPCRASYGPYLAGADFNIRMAQLRTAMKRSWSLGKWVFGVHISFALQGYLAYLMLTWLAGQRATGIYAACLSIATFCNPLIIGLGNILLPKAVLAFKEGNIARLQREVTWDLLLRVAPMALFCLVILLAGEELLYSALWQRGLRGACPPPFGADLFGSGPRRRLPGLQRTDKHGASPQDLSGCPTGGRAHRGSRLVTCR